MKIPLVLPFMLLMSCAPLVYSGGTAIGVASRGITDAPPALGPEILAPEVLAGGGECPAGSVRPAPTDSLLLATAVEVVRIAPSIASLWPGFWSDRSPFVLTDIS
jgi:hypothetical protein